MNIFVDHFFQGRFSVDLSGTPFKLSADVDWVSSGYRSTLDIVQEDSGGRISGRCGGYCGICQPNKKIGLTLTFR